MTSIPKQVIKNIFLLTFTFFLGACQTPALSLPTPTATRSHQTPSIPTAVKLDAPISSPQLNPVLQAFIHLEELDAYRMMITFTKGKEIYIRYVLEKKGQGNFRISFDGVEPDGIVLGDNVYSQDSSGKWRLVSNPSPYQKNEDWLLTLPTGDNGCMFDFENGPTIDFIFSTSSYFWETVVGFTDRARVIVDPPSHCELLINRDGYPQRIITETFFEDHAFVWLFTDFDGADILPIVAPKIEP